MRGMPRLVVALVLSAIACRGAASAQTSEPPVVLVVPGFAHERAIFGDDDPKITARVGPTIGVQARSGRTGLTALVFEGTFHMRPAENPHYPELFAPLTFQLGGQVGRTFHVRPSGGGAWQSGSVMPVAGVAVGFERRVGNYRVAPELAVRVSGSHGIAGWMAGVQVPIGPVSNRQGAEAALALAAFRRQPGEKRPNWIKRHPMLTGALIGFTGGFLIGYLPGDDGVFDDFTAEFNGAVLGAIGASAGALVGAFVVR